MSETPVRVRFAPSPTGKLHVGGARTAIYNWAFARANHGTFILRIDDTDPERSTEENTQIILRAMRWLGLDWDEGPEVGGDFGPYFQTERAEMYRAAAQRLWDEGKAYPCFCTPEQLAADREAAQARKDPFQGYQRRCRDLDPEEARARIEAGEPYVLRIKVPEDRGDVVVNDAVHGKVVFDAKELDDFVIFRSDGTPTYNFTTVVDDALMGVTQVVRGRDLLGSCARQIYLAGLLGFEAPQYGHVPLLVAPDGRRLAKREKDLDLGALRGRGVSAERIVGTLAAAAGLADPGCEATPAELVGAFSWSRLRREDIVVDDAFLAQLS